MSTRYEDGTYLESTGTWHAEDAPWKAGQIAEMIDRIEEPIRTLAEVGCGAGRILEALADHDRLQDAQLRGFDISPQAIELCREVDRPNVTYELRDPLDPADTERFDVLLAIDVFEHVPDYLGFLRACQAKATFKIYHVPLDIHVSSILRDQLSVARRNIGHLHYFTAKTAISTIEDTGHRILATQFTNGAEGLYRMHPSFRRAAANVPRRLIARFSTQTAANLLGGYSLLVLAE